MKFSGSYTIQATPFTPSGETIDVTAQRAFLDWQVESGVPGIILLGTIGEFWSITEPERAELIDITVQHLAGRLPVLAGVSAIDTRQAVSQAASATKAGVNGLMVSPPYYINATREEVLRHIGAVCERTDLPIMLYNNPHTCGVDMDAALVRKLADRFENVRYIKEASSDVGRVHDVIEATDGRVRVFAGERIVESFQLGAVGYTSALGTYAPRPSSKIWELLEKGRLDDALRIQRHLDAMGAVIADGHPLYGHTAFTKALAAAAGHGLGEVRAPLTTLQDIPGSASKLAELRAHLEDLERLVDNLPA